MGGISGTALPFGMHGQRDTDNLPRRAKCTRQRVERMGYSGIYNVSLMLYKDFGQIIKGGKAVQLCTQGSGFVEQDQTAHEGAG